MILKLVTVGLIIFKKRHDMRFRQVSGESANVSDEVSSDWKKLLRSLLAEYQPHNIFNGDETGRSISVNLVVISN